MEPGPAPLRAGFGTLSSRALRPPRPSAATEPSPTPRLIGLLSGQDAIPTRCHASALRRELRPRRGHGDRLRRSRGCFRGRRLEAAARRTDGWLAASRSAQRLYFQTHLPATGAPRDERLGLDRADDRLRAHGVVRLVVIVSGGFVIPTSPDPEAPWRGRAALAGTAWPRQGYRPDFVQKYTARGSGGAGRRARTPKPPAASRHPGLPVLAGADVVEFHDQGSTRCAACAAAAVDRAFVCAVMAAVLASTRPVSLSRPRSARPSTPRPRPSAAATADPHPRPRDPEPTPS